MFGRRHYEVVARAIYTAKECDPEYRLGAAYIKGHMEAVFMLDNPRFEAEKFNTYCETGHY